MMDSHSESEILNGKKRRREEKPEALASPEQEQGSKKKKRRKKKKKNKEKGAEPNEPPQVCPNKPLVEPTPIPINPEPNQSTLPDPKVTPKKRKRQKKNKNVVKPQGAQPHPEPKETTNAQHPQVSLKPSLEMTIPTDLEKKKEAEPSAEHPPIKKRKSKQRNRGGRNRTTCLDEMVENPRILLRLLRAQNHPQNHTQPDPPIPISPKPVSLIDQTIPVDPPPPIEKTIPVEPAPPIDIAIPVDPAPPIDQTVPVDPAPPIGQTISVDSVIPTDTEQKTNKKKRKRKRKSDLKSEGEKPSEHNGNPSETPVQRSIDPTVAIDQTTPIDPATPIDPEQKMTRKNRRMKRMSALKGGGSESDQHNANPTAEAPVQGTEGFIVIKGPMICHACRQPGHKFTRCQRLKHLSKDEEICFFCGEIGHSLGKCSVSLAGGGRFAKCLFCHAHGHFSYNCPGNGHGIDPKQWKLKGESVAEVTNM